jgi:hypothetical protein
MFFARRVIFADLALQFQALLFSFSFAVRFNIPAMCESLHELFNFSSCQNEPETLHCSFIFIFQ